MESTSNKKIIVAAFAVMVCAAMALRIGYGVTKTVFHVDEGITAAISNGTWLPEGDQGQYGKWLTKKEAQNLVFSNNLRSWGIPDYRKLSYVTGMDVHPPLYYWILATFRALFGAENIIAASIAMNGLFFLVSVWFFILIVRRLTRDPLKQLLILAIFMFSSVSISLTGFIRMYELLQAMLLGFFYFYMRMVFHEGDAPSWKHRLTSAAGVLVFTFLAQMTQYYFLFVLLPCGIFAVVYLCIKRRFIDLAIGLAAVSLGLLLAFAAFAPMKTHLFGSYRAKESVMNFSKRTPAQKNQNLQRFIDIVSWNSVPIVCWVLVGLAALAFYIFRKAMKKRPDDSAGPDKADVPLLPFASLVISISAFTIIVVSITSPFQTARYISAFFPYYCLAFSGLALLIGHRATNRAILAAAAVFVIAHGALPGNLLGFHEDYALDENPAYMTDARPIILVTNVWNANWMNPIIYMNVGDGKKLYVIRVQPNTDPTGDIRAAAASSGAAEVVVMVDHTLQYGSKGIAFGWYGFYSVHRVISRRP